MKHTYQFLFIMCVINALAYGACHVKQVCNDYGMNCQPQQICDSTLDIPSTEIAPLQPVQVPSIKPIDIPSVPPIGTTHCEQRWVCGNYNNCAWKEVCQ